VISATSTGIDSGGIVRGSLIVPAAGLSTKIADGFAYMDRNLPCNVGGESGRAAAQWKLLSHEGLYGWFPYRNLARPVADRDPYVRNRASGSTLGDGCPQ
jgi:hypothetical protein